MNVELKRIAEKKLEQMGGDVCGVLVRKGDKLAAVDEHGRVQWMRKAEEAEAKGRVLMDMCRDLKARVVELESQIWAVGADHCQAFILRKQAEAVDEVNRQLTKISEEAESRLVVTGLALQYAASTAGEEAQRLRQQADEAERAGGEL